MPLEKKIVCKRQLRRKVERKLKKVLADCIIPKNDNISSISTQLKPKDNEKLEFQTVTNIDSMRESHFINAKLLFDNEIDCKNTLNLSSIDGNESNSENSFYINNDVLIVNENDILAPSTADFNITEADSSRASTIVAEYTPVHNPNENNHSEYNDTKNAIFSIDNLRNWALRNNVTHTAIDELLQMLKATYNYLPLTARSLLKTPKQTKIFTLNNGNMCYFGIEMKLKQKLKHGLKVTLLDNVIQLDFNIDGLPLFKSSSTDVWPILLRSDVLIDDSPCVVGLFCGSGKPDSVGIIFT